MKNGLPWPRVVLEDEDTGTCSGRSRTTRCPLGIFLALLCSLLLSLEVVEQDRALLRLLAPVLDDHARAVDDLASVSFTVDLA